MNKVKNLEDSKNKKKLDIQILVDKDSWIMSHTRKLGNKLGLMGNKVELITSSEKVKKGDILAILGWEKILRSNVLKLHKHNLVVHESDLPRGRGWSPLTWQILEGKNEIPITLFEAAEKVDSGPIYFQNVMKFQGHELVDELREQQGRKTIELIIKFVSRYPNIVGKKQKGRETFYKRRRPEDSEINVNKSITQLFNNFRVADNEKYPVFFKQKGHKYILKIYKEENEPR